MEFEVSSEFKENLDMPEVEENISKGEVFVYDAEDQENFSMTLYANFGSDEVNSHAHRVTNASSEKYKKFVKDFLDNPEIIEDENEIFAISEDSMISFRPYEEAGATLTYHGDFSELKNVYIPGSEPVSREEYLEAVQIGISEFLDGLEEIDVDSHRIVP